MPPTKPGGMPSRATSDRDVEAGAADRGPDGFTSVGGPHRNKIDQRIATTQDHRAGPSTSVAFCPRRRITPRLSRSSVRSKLWTLRLVR